jgi:hypothetical protein
MSPPDTNLARQRYRHRWPLLGMFLVLAFAGVLGFVVLTRAGDAPTIVPADAVNPVMRDDGETGGPAEGDGAGEGQSPGTDGN